MRRPEALLFLAIATTAACRDRSRAPPPTNTGPDASSSPPASTPRVVCAPVQGPTKIADAGPDEPADGAIVASLDGSVALYLESREDDHHLPTYHVELRAPNEATRLVQLPGGGRDVAASRYSFRGPNVIGFGANRHFLVGGDNAYIVWATLNPRAVFAKLTDFAEVVDDSQVYFTDPFCRLHILDLQTGRERTGAVIASGGRAKERCSPFHVWAGAIAIGKSRYYDSGITTFLTGVDFGDRVVDPYTGTPRPKPYCPLPVGRSCLTLEKDLHVTFDDDPAGPASSSSRFEAFEIRGPQGEMVRGATEEPHHQLSPDHVVLWKNATGRAVALVAARVEGVTGPQLIVVDDDRVSVAPLSAEEAIDQRRIAALRSFVPYQTRPAQVATLLRERQTALAASAQTDRVQFMPYSAAASAGVPCTAPPP